MPTNRVRRRVVAVRSRRSSPAAAVLRGIVLGSRLECQGRPRKLNGIHISRTMLSHRSILISPLHVPIGESACHHALSLPLPPPARDRLLETSYTRPGRRLTIGSYKGKWCAPRCVWTAQQKHIPRRAYLPRPCPDDADHNWYWSGASWSSGRGSEIQEQEAAASDPSRSGLRRAGRIPQSMGKNNDGPLLRTLTFSQLSHEHVSNVIFEGAD